MRCGSTIILPTEYQPIIWKCLDKPALKKFKAMKSARKVMRIMFWDVKGPLHGKYLLYKKKWKNSIIVECYFDTVIHLQNSIRAKRQGLLSCSVIFRPNNATPHTAGTLSPCWMILDCSCSSIHIICLFRVNISKAHISAVIFSPFWKYLFQFSFFERVVDEFWKTNPRLVLQETLPPRSLGGLLSTTMEFLSTMKEL